ncbi:MAG TPA: hypothetical protein VJH03_22750 [Blastocatellia bacterium]|nr:hypothetical protein [Blastocatellia bacterium]
MDTKPTLETLLDRINKLGDELRGEINGLRGEVNGLRGEVNGLGGEVNGLRGEVNGLREEMREEMRELRLEMHQGFHKLERKLAAHGSLVMDYKTDLDLLEDRVEKLESKAS